MRNVFLISFAMNILLTVVTLVIGPSEVAIHFGPGGEPNGWASATVNALIMSGVNLLMFASFFFAPHLMRVTPAKWINLPNKDYWLRPENRERMESILMRHLYVFGTLTFAFLFVIGILVLDANLSQPAHLREDFFWWPFGLYMAYTAYWCVKIFLDFRIPKDEAR